MGKPDLQRLEELRERYPADTCRQIALYVMEGADALDEDRLCAARILSALDTASHAEYLTVIPVNQWTLSIAAFQDAERLWARYVDIVS